MTAGGERLRVNPGESVQARISGLDVLSVMQSDQMILVCSAA